MNSGKWMLMLLCAMYFINPAYGFSSTATDESDEEIAIDEEEMPTEATQDVTMAPGPAYGTLLVDEDRSENEMLARLLVIHNSVYDKRTGPRLADGQAINVSMSISLRGIMDANEYKGYIAINAEMGFKWYDPRLTWDAGRFSNLTAIPVSDNEIYHPTIYLLNSWNAKEANVFAPAPALVYNTGKVLWYPRATLKAPCYVDARYWPFTSMECDFVFGSPLINDHEVRLYFHTNAVYVRSYMEGHQWRLIKGGQFMVPENMDDLRRKYGKELPWIRLYFEHRPNQFLFTFALAPVVVAIVAGMLFACTTDMRVNIVLGIMEIMFFAGLHFYLSFVMPPATKTPLFGIFIADTLLLIVGLLFFTYVIAFVQKRQSSPPRVVSIIGQLIAILCCNPPIKPISPFPGAGPQMTLIHKVLWRNFATFIKIVVVVLYFASVLALGLIALLPFMEKLNTRWEVERATLDSLRPLT